MTTYRGLSATITRQFSAELFAFTMLMGVSKYYYTALLSLYCIFTLNRNNLYKTTHLASDTNILVHGTYRCVGICVTTDTLNVHWQLNRMRLKLECWLTLILWWSPVSPPAFAHIVLCENQVSSAGTSDYIPQYPWDNLSVPILKTCFWHKTADVMSLHYTNTCSHVQSADTSIHCKFIINILLTTACRQLITQMATFIDNNTLTSD